MKIRALSVLFLFGLQSVPSLFPAVLFQESAPITKKGLDTIGELLNETRALKKEQGESAAVSFFTERVTENQAPTVLQVVHDAIHDASDQEIPFLIRLGRIYIPQEYTAKQGAVPGAFMVVAGRRNSVGKVFTFFVQDDGIIKKKSEQTLPFKPVALAVDPAGKWIAASSSLVGTQSSIAIFKQRNDGTLTLVHTLVVRGGPVVALSYDPTGNWLVAASLAGLSLYAQVHDGSLQKMDSDIPRVGGPSLKYNPVGDAIASTSDLRSKVVILAQDKAQLQEKGELPSSLNRFTDVCFASDGTLFVAEESSTPTLTTLKQYRIDISTGSFELVGSFPMQALITSLAPHPNLKMLAVALNRTILLLEWDRAGQLRIKKEYLLPEFGVNEEIVAQYDESGNWLGALNTDTGDFVLFKQDGATLKQVDRYACNLEYAKFGFFYPRALKKAFVAESITKDIPEDLKKLIAKFVAGD